MAIQQSTMRELALFAGAGGGILGGKLLGWRTVCAVEWDVYAAFVLVARQNDKTLEPFPIWDDVQTFDGRPWRGLVDVVSGGFPCQPFSTAARGRNIEEKNMWREMRRVIAEVQPRFVFAENVSKAAIDAAADDIEQMGYTVKCIELSASDVGADHVRSRFWLRAHANNQSQLCGGVNAKMDIVPKLCTSVWSSAPDQSRVVDGLANRVDRLKAIGNGQVPAVAATAWRILND
jgi:DNA (cytosine-5)-methyltransferase 1